MLPINIKALELVEAKKYKTISDYESYVHNFMGRLLTHVVSYDIIEQNRIVKDATILPIEFMRAARQILAVLPLADIEQRSSVIALSVDVMDGFQKFVKESGHAGYKAYIFHQETLHLILDELKLPEMVPLEPANSKEEKRYEKLISQNQVFKKGGRYYKSNIENKMLLLELTKRLPLEQQKTRVKNLIQQLHDMHLISAQNFEALKQMTNETF